MHFNFGVFIEESCPIIKKKNQIEVKCKLCEKVMLLFPCQIKVGRAFCSMGCYSSWRKGKSYKEIYEDGAEEERKKRGNSIHESKQKSIKEGTFHVWNTGLSLKDERVRRQGRNISKGIRKSFALGNFSGWNKGLTKEIDERVKGYGMKLSKKWRNPEYQKSWKESRSWERKVAESIKEDYNFFVSPTCVCDKIAFKGNTIYFIEIKHPKNHGSPSSDLRPLQKKFKEFIESLKNEQIKYLVERELKHKE